MVISKKRAELLRTIKACKADLESTATTAEFKAERAKELQKALVELAGLPADNITPDYVNGGKDNMNKLAMIAINKAIRGLALTDEEKAAIRNDATPTGQQGGVDAKGGYLVPKEFVASVERLANEDARLKNYVHVYPTTYRKGSYPIRDEAATGLTKRAELTLMTPKDINFDAVEFDIENWYDFIPVANELIDDANVDILELVREAFVEDLVLQENKEILTAMGVAAGGTATEISSYKDIVTTLNKGIKVAARKNAVIVTNQDGWAYLDSLEDAQYHPLLVPDIKDPGIKRLKGAEIVVLDNTTLADGTTVVDEGEVTEKTVKTIPFFVGDLRKAVLFADREGYAVQLSKEAGFLQEATYLKITPRFDVVKKFSGCLKKLALVTDEVVE